jgi:lipoprotein-anchoring transpeptidase ErfK/SrfK
LSVLKGKFSIRVSKSRNDLIAMLDGKFFKRYRVATGKFGKTPVGVFKISDRIKEPVWWRPDGKEVPFGDPENILGTRWMAIQPADKALIAKGYGIHGTWDDASIGKAASAGCIRMHNKEVEELFDLLPLGTNVTITE